MSMQFLRATASAPKNRLKRWNSGACLLTCAVCQQGTRVARIMQALGFGTNYIDIRTAGATLPLFEKNSMEPFSSETEEKILEQLHVAQKLRPRRSMYLVNHQDCRAFKVMMTREGGAIAYPMQPSTSQHMKDLELSIHAEALLAAKARLSQRVDGEIHLGVLDDAGAYGLLDEKTGEWQVVVPAEFYDARALFTKAEDDLKGTPQLPCELTHLNLSKTGALFPISPPLAPLSSPRIGTTFYLEVAAM